MHFQEAARRIIGRLFRADGDHITDFRIPVFNRPVNAVAFPRVPIQRHRSIEEPVYFEVFAYTKCEAA